MLIIKGKLYYSAKVDMNKLIRFFSRGGDRGDHKGDVSIRDEIDSDFRMEQLKGGEKSNQRIHLLFYIS